MYNVIFDLDGTLWDATKIVAVAFREYLHENYDPNFYVTEDVLMGLFGKTMRDIAMELFPSETKERQEELLAGCCEREHEHLEKTPAELYPKVEETLQKLMDLGCRLFVVSNSQAGYIELFIKAKRLEKYFEGHLCYGDTGRPKSYNIQKIVEDYRIENPLYVGDTDGDHKAAVKAGVPFVFATYGYGKTENPRFRIDEFEELLKIVKES